VHGEIRIIILEEIKYILHLENTINMFEQIRIIIPLRDKNKNT